MKKEEIYVSVENKEQAETFRKVLEAIGEPICHDYYPFNEKTNRLCYVGGWYLSGEKFTTEKITFGELIDLLQRKPLLISEDGVEFFENDKHWMVDVENNCLWKANGIGCYNVYKDSLTIDKPEKFKAFSSESKALEWIEEQKPKYKSVNTYFGLEARIMDNSEIHIYKDNDFYIKLSYGDIHDIKTFLTD